MAKILGPGDGELVDLGGLGVRFMIDGETAGGGFALVEHPIAPRTLAAPMHTHEHEDEYSYVTEGRVTIEIDGHAVEAGVGDFVLKPRGVPHAFWNPGDEPLRFVAVYADVDVVTTYEDEVQPSGERESQTVG